MTHVVCLTALDRHLLRARFTEHGNSHRRMLDALRDAGAEDACARVDALRRIERRYNLDLAEICHRFERRQSAETHAIERMVLDFVAEERHHETGVQLWVMPARVEQVRELMNGRLVGDVES